MIKKSARSGSGSSGASLDILGTSGNSSTGSGSGNKGMKKRMQSCLSKDKRNGKSILLMLLSIFMFAIILYLLGVISNKDAYITSLMDLKYLYNVDKVVYSSDEEEKNLSKDDISDDGDHKDDHDNSEDADDEDEDSATETDSLHDGNRNDDEGNGEDINGNKKDTKLDVINSLKGLPERDPELGPDSGSSDDHPEIEETTKKISNDKTKFKSTIVIITGTHLPQNLKVTKRQHILCIELSQQLHKLWAAWDTVNYSKTKSKVHEVLKKISNGGVSCTLDGPIMSSNIKDVSDSSSSGETPETSTLPSSSIQWSFPMSYRPQSECDLKTKTILAKKSYLREKTKVYVNWFIIRPDLVTFQNIALAENIRPIFFVSIGHDPKTASFSKEGCPRFNTILEKREIYRERLLLVALSDISLQLSKIQSNLKIVYRCSSNDLENMDPISTSGESAYNTVEYFMNDAGLNIQSFDSLKCESRPELKKRLTKSHIGSLLMMPLFSEKKLPKTVFTGPRLVFVAGLEGVGHHLFSLMGRWHTLRDLYESLTDHLCDSAWDDDSENKYATARERLRKSMENIKNPENGYKYQDDGVYFLNTIWSQRDVNMYSYPWGGPRCYLKKYARIMCNIDTIELAKIAEEAGVDFRIILLRRSVGAAVVSAALHRPFGSVVSETRMLAGSWAVLKVGIDSLDPRFILDISYEEMMNHPQESANKIFAHLGIKEGTKFANHISETLSTSSIEHPVGDGMKWKEEVSLTQLQFMGDMFQD